MPFTIDLKREQVYRKLQDDPASVEEEEKVLLQVDLPGINTVYNQVHRSIGSPNITIRSKRGIVTAESSILTGYITRVGGAFTYPNINTL